MQLHQPKVLHQLAELEASLLVLSFAGLEQLLHWVPYFPRTFLAPSYASMDLTPPSDPYARTRFLADPERAVYHGYGLGHNSIWRVYGPRIIWQYVRWGLQGKPIGIRDDTLQRGGDFVVGRVGRLTLTHTGHDQSDRPSPEATLAALRHG